MTKKKKSGFKKQRGSRSSKSKAYENSKSISQDKENPNRWPADVMIKFPGIGFPDRLRIRVKYTETVGFSAAVSPAAQVWLLNTIFHINNTSSTGNPSFYTTLGGIYKKYVVMGIEGLVEVFYINTQTANTSGTWAFQLSDINSGSKTVTQMLEGKYVLHGTTSAVQNVAAPTSFSAPISRRKIPYTSMAMMNGQKEIESDPDLYASVGADPVDTVFGVFRIASDDGATNAVGRVRITIFLDVIFKDLVDIVP